MRLRAERELAASVPEVWSLLAEPYHLSDWWPGYSAVRPDRRGLAAGARWALTRTDRPGLLRQPRGQGLLVITHVESSRGFAWRDIQQRFEATVSLRAAGGGAEATLVLEAPSWRVPLEGLTRLPRQALARLHALCQTAAQL